jgi:hypothetical protein
MKKKLSLLGFCLIITITSFAQVEFSTYSINNVGRITIPDNMELQSGSYKKMVDRQIGEILQIDARSRTTFQVKGTNNLEQQAVNSFARVIIEQPMTETLTNFRAMPQMCNDLREMLQQQLASVGQKIVKWNGCTMRKINGVEVFVVSYHRQDRNYPYAVVNNYYFYKNGKIYNITMSYRHTEESTWKPLFEMALNSFVIN